MLFSGAASCLSERHKHHTLGIQSTCLSDGSYAPVQCHAETNICWCISRDGHLTSNITFKKDHPQCVSSSHNFLKSLTTVKPPILKTNAGRNAVESTLAKKSMFNLHQRNFSTEAAARLKNLRREHRDNHKQNWKRSRNNRQSYSDKRNKNICDVTNKAKFNRNLIENFKIEHRRTGVILHSK